MGTASALPKQILASMLAEILVADAMFLHTQGHDAFLVDFERFGPAVASFLASL